MREESVHARRALALGARAHWPQALLAALPCVACVLAACSGPAFELGPAGDSGALALESGAVLGASSHEGGGLEDVPPVWGPDALLPDGAELDAGGGGLEGSVPDVRVPDDVLTVRAEAGDDAPVAPEATTTALDGGLDANDSGAAWSSKVCCQWGPGNVTSCLPPSQTPRPELNMTSFGCWTGAQGSSTRVDDCGRCAVGLKCAQNFGGVGTASPGATTVTCPGGP